MLKKDINKGILKVIQVSDNEHSDYTQLCDFDKEEFLRRNYKREIQKQQFIGSRLGLCQLLHEVFQTTYGGLLSDNGKPQKINNLHISLSHSNQYVAIAINERKIGVDIQAVLPKIDRVAPRVFNAFELDFCDSHILKTIVWSAKEALYKYAECEGLDFKTALLVDHVELDKNIISGSARIIVNKHTETVNLEGLLFDNYVLVHTA